MSNTLKIAIAIVVIALLIYGIFYLKAILTYILVAGFLALLGRPIMDSLLRLKWRKLKIPTGICALITIISFYAVIFGFISMFLPLVIRQFQVLVKVISGIDYIYLVKTLGSSISQLEEFLCQYSITGEDINIYAYIQDNLNRLLNQFSFYNIFGTFIGLFGNIFNIIATLFSITFIMFFFLIDKNLFYRTAINFVPPTLKNSFDNIVQTSGNLLTRYFVGVFLQIITVGSFVTLGLAIFDVENELLIGFFAGVINIIPYIGPIIGMVFGLFVGLTTNIDEADFLVRWLPLTIKILSIIFTVQLIDNIFLQPYIFSNSIKAHPLEIFLLISVGYTFAGIGGMILAIPCYTVIRVLVQELIKELQAQSKPSLEVPISPELTGSGNAMGHKEDKTS